jgi:hypothetical protein
MAEAVGTFAFRQALSTFPITPRSVGIVTMGLSASLVQPGLRNPRRPRAQDDRDA